MIINLRDYDENKMSYRFTGEPAFITMVGAGFLKKNGYIHDWPGGAFKHFSASLVLRGRGTYIDEAGNQYPLEPGSLFFRIPGINHANDIDPDSDWLEYFVALAFVEDFTTNYSESKAQTSLAMLSKRIFMINPVKPILQVGISVDLLRQFESFFKHLKECHTPDSLPVKALQLITTMIQHVPPSSTTDPLIDRAVEIIRANINNRIPLPELLKSLPLSYVRLREKFSQQMGKSMGSYQLEARMERALELLYNRKRVNEVAFQLGYKDQFAFSRQFSKLIGYPPSKLMK